MDITKGQATVVVSVCRVTDIQHKWHLQGCEITQAQVTDLS